MKYQKVSYIFAPNSNYDWMYYYASPVTCVLHDSFIRVYFTTRSKLDSNGFYKTVITFLDCEKNDPSKILSIHNKPILETGFPGTFDEHGTMVADVVRYDNKYYMYYMGWQRSDTVPYIIQLGLAVSNDGINFNKISDGPVIGTNRFLPYGIGNVSVLIEDNKFRMWFTHYNQWIITKDNTYRPTYEIREAASLNGFDWQLGEKCIIPNQQNEALATPCVRKINGKYHMWYSYRPGVDATGNSGSYSIGYAFSEANSNWQRADDLMTMEVSISGWDSQMFCYPDVLVAENNIYMFYCGNHYGKEGFGYAKILDL